MKNLFIFGQLALLILALTSCAPGGNTKLFSNLSIIIIILIFLIIAYFRIKSAVKSKTAKQTAIYCFIIGLVSLILSQTVSEIKNSPLYYIVLFVGILFSLMFAILLYISKNKE